MISLKKLLLEHKANSLMDSLSKKFNFSWKKSTKKVFTNKFMPLQHVSHPNQINFDGENIIYDIWHSQVEKDFDIENFLKAIKKKYKISKETRDPNARQPYMFIEFGKEKETFTIYYNKGQNFLSYEAIKDI
jgi:hypothetical protein